MYEYSCVVDRVVDGDTVDVTIDLGFKIFHKARVRMYGIDTPESRTRNKDEKARGLLSKSFLQEQIDNCTKLVIQTKKDAKGKFGRILGDLVADGKNINQLMISKHMAVRYIGQSKSDIESEHLLNRKILIKEGLFTPVEK